MSTPSKESFVQTAVNLAFDWMKEVTSKLPYFLKLMQDPNIPGRYRYSLSGDIPRTDWGLGNAVYGVKIHHMLGLKDSSGETAVAHYIQSYQQPNGSISDALVLQMTRWRRLAQAVKSGRLDNLSGKLIQRAETRQAVAALCALGVKPQRPYLELPNSGAGIVKYLHSLNWKQPWGAASHVSHLVFFLVINHRFFGLNQDLNYLLDTLFDELNHYRQRDGSWYASGISLPLYEKINSAMKIITAYLASHRDDFDQAETLIDLCLSSLHGGHACNHFNIVCVLYYCAQKTEHRREEITAYFENRLSCYREHYWPESGGFSFFKRQAGTHYYGARVSRGLPEPDIHGTHLFLWGLVLISDYFGLREEMNLRHPIT